MKIGSGEVRNFPASVKGESENAILRRSVVVEKILKFVCFGHLVVVSFVLICFCYERLVVSFFLLDWNLPVLVSTGICRP